MYGPAIAFISMMVTSLPLTAVTQATWPTLEEPWTPGCITRMERVRGTLLTV